MRLLREEKALGAKQGPCCSQCKGRVSTRGIARVRRIQSGSSYTMPILIGAAMIAAAILLSTLITALGSRYVGFESPNEESAWLIDRLTGSVYKCSAPERGRASCEAEIATGSIVGRGKR